MSWLHPYGRLFSRFFLGLGQFLSEALRFISLKVVMGFCMAFTGAILDGVWGRPRLTVKSWASFWVTRVQKGTTAYFCMIAKNCAFPEKCCWEGEDKTRFVSWGYGTDKMRWFCLLGFFVVGLLWEGFFVCVFFNILFKTSQYQWQDQHSDYFCTGMSENECVYCQENVSFHLGTLK